MEFSNRPQAKHKTCLPRKVRLNSPHARPNPAKPVRATPSPRLALYLTSVIAPNAQLVTRSFRTDLDAVALRNRGRGCLHDLKLPCPVKISTGTHNAAPD